MKASHVVWWAGSPRAESTIFLVLICPTCADKKKTGGAHSDLLSSPCQHTTSTSKTTPSNKKTCRTNSPTRCPLNIHNHVSSSHTCPLNAHPLPPVVTVHKFAHDCLTKSFRYIVRKADPAPVRWSEMPPLPPDHPPSQSQTHADARDEGMRRALEVVMGRFPGDDSQKEMAWNKSLGLRFRQHLGWIACPCCRRGSTEVTTNIMDRWPWVNCVQQAGGWTREGSLPPSPTQFPLSLASGSGSTHFKPFLFKSIMRSGFTFHSSFALRQNGCDRVRPDRPTQAASPGNFWLVWLFLCVCVLVSVLVLVLVCGGVVCGEVCVCCVTVLPQDRPAGPPFRRTALSPDRLFAALHRTALHRTAQNFALCFPSPASLHFRSFSLSLGVFLWNFGGVLKAGALKCALLEFSDCRVKPRSHAAQRVGLGSSASSRDSNMARRRQHSSSHGLEFSWRKPRRRSLSSASWPGF